MDERNKTKPIVILSGRIVHGKGLGRTVGMPTANLETFEGQTLPSPGVYASRMMIGDRVYDSVTNIGSRPTVDSGEDPTIETYIIDFAGDIYGEEVTLIIHQFLRQIQKFSSLEEVQKQVQEDIQKAQSYFKLL